MSKLTRLIIVASVVLVVVVGGISWFVFAAGDDMGEGATSAKSVDEAKVPVSVVLSADARRLKVIIDWNDELDALRGDDRFAARVMAGSKEIELKQWEDTRPDVDSFTLEFTEAEATLLLAAVDNGDAVVAVSQQSDTDLDSDSLYEANYATVLRIPTLTASARPADVATRLVIQLASMRESTAGSVRTAATGGTRDCAHVNHVAGADLAECNLWALYMPSADLSGANLTFANLAGADLSGANLTGANLTIAYLFGATLSGATLSGANFTGANLFGATLTDANLTGANFTGANIGGATLTGANLTGATLTGANLFGATCPSGNVATGTPKAC
jgi:uncharacterized protein YjbI with pentapeptide repeats